VSLFLEDHSPSIPLGLHDDHCIFCDDYSVEVIWGAVPVREFNFAQHHDTIR
jgi:hypothetical protein